MTNETFTSVWDAIEDTPAEAENMKLRSALVIAIKDHIKRNGWTQAEAARRLGVTQPRISDLMRGKVDLFGIDALVNMAATAGLHVELRILEAAQAGSVHRPAEGGRSRSMYLDAKLLHHRIDKADVDRLEIAISAEP